MSEIQVLSPGMLTTVQDLGRGGYGPLGVSPSGAGDAVSLRVGNRLVGNDEGEAGLEMTLLGGTFQFPNGAAIALSGSDFGVSLDGAPVAMWSSFEVKPGQTLRLGPTRSGARCYLCVRGGIAVQLFLGSASTHLLSGLGGLDGRALRKGDVLPIGPAKGAFRVKHLAANAWKKLAPQKVLRVTSGPQGNWFPEAAQRVFFENTYRVAEESNRMGLRLEGPAISDEAHGEGSGKEPGHGAGKAPGEMISEGVSLGAIQIAAGGQPIILFVEQQTTGGYAKIANVISADLHSLGQLRPRDEIRFERVGFETARALLIEQEKLLASKELIV